MHDNPITKITKNMTRRDLNFSTILFVCTTIFYKTRQHILTSFRINRRRFILRIILILI